MPRYETLLRKVTDWPKQGIDFIDISHMLADPFAFKRAIDAMAEQVEVHHPDLLAAMDARGFLFASALSYKLGLGTVMIRKAGKLPGQCASLDYQLEYGSGTLEVQKDLIRHGSKVVVIDDILATGGTIFGAVSLLRSCGATVPAACVFLELQELKGRQNLPNYLEVSSLVQR